jgi:anti-anti-sigma regulatory factor
MSTSTPLRIEGEFTIFRAAELKPLLLNEPAPSEIDLSGVSEIDTAGVQLLMLAKQAALANKSELRLVGHSPAVLEVFELLNVAAYFSDPLVMASRADAGDGRASNAASSRKSHGY